MTTHHVTITEHDDGNRRLYCPHCSCRWHGWPVIGSDAAERQGDRHLEQAEIDARTLDEARKGERDV